MQLVKKQGNDNQKLYDFFLVLSLFFSICHSFWWKKPWKIFFFEYNRGVKLREERFSESKKYIRNVYLPQKTLRHDKKTRSQFTVYASEYLMQLCKACNTIAL